LDSWKLQFPQEFERTLEAWSSEIGNAISLFRKAIDEPRKMVQRFAEQNAELLEALRSFDVVLPALVEDMERLRVKSCNPTLGISGFC
jgi:hypothetical protein